MSNVSLLSVARGRYRQLCRVLQGVAEQVTRPREVILVFINEPVPERLPDPGCPVYTLQLGSADARPPFAAARNLAAGRAAGEVLAFLDPDCIPAPDFVTQLESAVQLTHGLVVSDVHYLPEQLPEEGWFYDRLQQLAVPHPRRPVVPDGHALLPLPHTHFRSQAFGVRMADFSRLGGFDEAYVGYGGEVSDLAYRARTASLSLYMCAARVYHQHHPGYTPPYDHLSDIVDNAQRFYAKWHIWPMEDWLRQFAAEGLIRWESDTISVVKEPGADRLEAARRRAPFG